MKNKFNLIEKVSYGLINFGNDGLLKSIDYYYPQYANNISEEVLSQRELVGDMSQKT